jgi:dUTP pyrophosphatase
MSPFENIFNKINEIIKFITCPVEMRIKMEDKYKHLVPRKEHRGDAGYDLRAAIDDPVVVSPGEVKLIPVGFSCALPEGCELQIRPRSGLALKNYISVLNTPGTIDSNYRGPVGVLLYNFGKYDYTVHPFDRIAQGIVCKLPEVNVVEVSELEDTDRGEGGFGSTGKE